MILLGDTNCDLTRRQDEKLIDNNAKHMANIYELFSFKQLIEEPTRVTLETATIIDHIATTCARDIVKAGVHEVSLSDHYMVYCIRKFNGAVEKDHKRIKTRNMKNFKEDEFLSDVSDICWEHMFLQTDDTNTLVNAWSALFSSIIGKHAPLREMRVSEKYCPWIDKDLKGLMVARDRLKKAALKNKSPILMDSYRQIRNRVNSLNIQLKKQYFSTKISECRGNMKESWKAINELLNKRSKFCNIDCLKDSGNGINNRKEISNIMNSFFCTIGEELASKIDATPNPLLSGDYFDKNNIARFRFRTIEVQEIRDALAKTKTSKSFGNDNISCYFLKLALPFIENSLACLFNTSLVTSQFPDSWKLPELHQFSRKETKLKSQFIALFQFYLLSQGSLKDLWPTSCTNT